MAGFGQEGADAGAGLAALVAVYVGVREVLLVDGLGVFEGDGGADGVVVEEEVVEVGDAGDFLFGEGGWGGGWCCG